MRPEELLSAELTGASPEKNFVIDAGEGISRARLIPKP